MGSASKRGGVPKVILLPDHAPPWEAVMDSNLTFPLQGSAQETVLRSLPHIKRCRGQGGEGGPPFVSCETLNTTSPL